VAIPEPARQALLVAVRETNEKRAGKVSYTRRRGRRASWPCTIASLSFWRCKTRS